MKLEVGMYVRTKYGIAKIINIFDKEHLMNICGRIQTEKYGLDEKDILKASHNIIDLIEVGDYVNGYYVSKIWEVGEITHYVDDKPIQRKNRQITIQAPSYGGIIHLHNEDIKSIVTKEQFKSISYEVSK